VVINGNSHHLQLSSFKETNAMTTKATVLLVLKRLALSRSTYKLVGILLVALGFTSGTDAMGWVSTLLCVAVGGCGE
jgi:hypothetical protein